MRSYSRVCLLRRTILLLLEDWEVGVGVIAGTSGPVDELAERGPVVDSVGIDEESEPDTLVGRVDAARSDVTPANIEEARPAPEKELKPKSKSMTGKSLHSDGSNWKTSEAM